MKKIDAFGFSLYFTLAFFTRFSFSSQKLKCEERRIRQKVLIDDFCGLIYLRRLTILMTKQENEFAWVARNSTR